MASTVKISGPDTGGGGGDGDDTDGGVRGRTWGVFCLVGCKWRMETRQDVSVRSLLAVRCGKQVGSRASPKCAAQCSAGLCKLQKAPRVVVWVRSSMHAPRLP
jgi:hypothetical protein